MFIVMEGGDGVGKSTQLSLLQKDLEERGYPVRVCREPGSTRLGEAIRRILLHERSLSIDRMSELLLFMAARAQVTNEVIRPALARGEVVLADRFLLSSIVYQGYAGGLEIESLWEIGRIATGNLQPDMTILLDLPVAESQRRRCGEPDRLESESTLFHERVRQGFLTEARRAESGIWVLSASETVEELHRKILDRVEKLLGKNIRCE